MGPGSIVEDTEWRWFYLQTDAQKDRQMYVYTDRWTKWNQYTPLNFVPGSKIMA